MKPLSIATKNFILDVVGVQELPATCVCYLPIEPEFQIKTKKDYVV